jgi:hypothetical protein
MRRSNFIITMTATALILPMAESTRDAVRPLPLFIVDATDEQVTGPNSW